MKAFVDGNLVLGVECKAYTENAMLKRILVDFTMLRTLYPNLICGLLQLESQLGGSFSKPLADSRYGSPSSHTLMSYFPDVALKIVTLLEGERKVDKPIHALEHFKEMDPVRLDWGIAQLSDLLDSCPTGNEPRRRSGFQRRMSPDSRVVADRSGFLGDPHPVGSRPPPTLTDCGGPQFGGKLRMLRIARAEARSSIDPDRTATTLSRRHTTPDPKRSLPPTA